MCTMRLPEIPPRSAAARSCEASSGTSRKQHTLGARASANADAARLFFRLATARSAGRHRTRPPACPNETASVRCFARARGASRTKPSPSPAIARCRPQVSEAAGDAGRRLGAGLMLGRGRVVPNRLRRRAMRPPEKSAARVRCVSLATEPLPTRRRMVAPAAGNNGLRAPSQCKVSSNV